MPTIYRVVDSSGKSSGGIDSAVAGLVILDGLADGQLLTDSYQALLVGDDIISLPHPLEQSTLEQHRQTYLSASLAGVLLAVQRRICLGCGSVFDDPRLAFSPAAGCLPALSCAVITFVVLHFGFARPASASLLAAFGAFLFVMLVFSLAADLYLRFRFSHRYRSIRRPRCATCRDAGSITLAGGSGRSTPTGDGRQIRVTIAGRS